MQDFIAVTGYLGRRIIQDHCSICGVFSDAEIELAQNGMQGEIEPNWSEANSNSRDIETNWTCCRNILNCSRVAYQAFDL